MELINNISKTLRDDIVAQMKAGSRLSVAASCFSIYAFQELKEALKDIKELRFIFTSPTFTTEKTPKQQREFYIPRLDRERTLYGSEFEMKFRNELTQKAIARECAEWIREKACFKSNKTNEQMMGFYISWQKEIKDDLEIIRLLLLMLQSITPEHDSKLQQLICDLKDKFTHPINGNNKMKNRTTGVNIDHKNQLHPFYKVYIKDDGEVLVDHLHPKDLLDKMRLLCKPMTKPDVKLCSAFNKETRDGLRMGKYSDLLSKAINSIISVKEQSDVDSFLEGPRAATTARACGFAPLK